MCGDLGPPEVEELVAPGRVVVVEGDLWLRTNWANTSGVAAKVVHFDRLGKQVRIIDRF